MAGQTDTSDVVKDLRRHDLDALRATAMLLGIALHAALSFMPIPWIVQDKFQSPAFGAFVQAIHAFRLPLFFLLSGYFSLMLIQKRGIGGLLLQRTKRVLLPLVIGCVTIVPLVWGAIILSAVMPSEARPPDPSRDIWSAAAAGDVEAVQRHLDAGASLDEPDPIIKCSPLGWTAFEDKAEVAALLLEAGADPDYQYGDNNTALHSAAFFGRPNVAMLLLDAGANPHYRNRNGDRPIDSIEAERGMTEFIAKFLKIPIDFEEVSAGREVIRPRLEAQMEAIAPPPETDSGGDIGETLRGIVEVLMKFPFFHHLWFLWFLCWLVLGLAGVVAVLKFLPPIRVPPLLVATPLSLIWLVPLTMLTQSWQTGDGLGPAFGPDTSPGLLPMPHVMAHYVIFFGFGALMYSVSGAADRLGRGWWVKLPLALAVLPIALGFTFNAEWTIGLVEDAGMRRFIGLLMLVLYTWCIIFGLMGMFEAWLNHERPRVRYVSDSSYWLYLAHLPLVIVGQILLRDAAIPSLVKFLVITIGATVLLLISYEYLVRYTLIGRLLNGRRTRQRSV